MNRIHCVLLTILLAFAASAFAVDSSMVAATVLEKGYFDITNLSNKWGYEISFSSKDSIDGIYLYVEHGYCADPYMDSRGVIHYLLRLYIGKNMAGSRNDSIWVLMDFFDKDSINSELKKGKPLTLEKFTKLEFDSSREQYLVNSYRPYESEINSAYDSTNAIFYILYQRGDSVAAFCGIDKWSCYYEIGCLYNKEGRLVFDSIPDPYEMVTLGRGCILCGEEDDEEYLRPVDRAVYKQNNDICPLYKVNGTPATKNSSNIVIQNKKHPKLKLKGNR